MMYKTYLIGMTSHISVFLFLNLCICSTLLEDQNKVKGLYVTCESL